MTTSDLSLIKTDIAVHGIVRDERYNNVVAERNIKLCKRRLYSYIHDNLVLQRLISMGLKSEVYGCTIHGEDGPKFWANIRYHPKVTSKIGKAR